jgi:hypothetical protein
MDLDLDIERAFGFPSFLAGYVFLLEGDVPSLLVPLLTRRILAYGGEVLGPGDLDARTPITHRILHPARPLPVAEEGEPTALLVQHLVTWMERETAHLPCR